MESDLPLEQHHRLLALSLSQRQAKQTLVDSVALQLQRERRRHTKQRRTWELLVALADPGTLYATLSGVVVLICAGPACVEHHRYGEENEWGIAHGWAGILLLCIGILNAWILARERHLTSIELVRRVEVWLSRVAQQNSLFRGVTRTASSRTCMVMRDGVWIALHPNLLVHGDVIALRLGDVTPAAATTAFPDANGDHYSIAGGSVFAPIVGVDSTVGTSTIFVLQEDVAATCVLALFGRQTGLSSPRRERYQTPLSKQIHMATTRLLPLLAALLVLQAAVLQMIAFAMWEVDELERAKPPLSSLPLWILRHFVPHAVELWLPLLPVALPAFFAVAEAFASAQLLSVLTGMPITEEGDGMGRDSGSSSGEASSGAHAALPMARGLWAWVCAILQGSGRSRRYLRFDAYEPGGGGLLGRRTDRGMLSSVVNSVVPGVRSI